MLQHSDVDTSPLSSYITTPNDTYHPSLSGNAVLIQPAVPHIKQLFGWDCGLACVAMVLGFAAERAVVDETARHHDDNNNSRRTSTAAASVSSSFPSTSTSTKLSLLFREALLVTEEANPLRDAAVALRGIVEQQHHHQRQRENEFCDRSQDREEYVDHHDDDNINPSPHVEWLNFVHSRWQRLVAEAEAIAALRSGGFSRRDGSAGGWGSSAGTSVWTIDLLWLVGTLLLPAPGSANNNNYYDGREGATHVVGDGGDATVKQQLHPEESHFEKEEEKLRVLTDFFSRTVQMTTTQVGVCNTYANVPFYSQAFQSDSPRITQRFGLSKQRGWSVLEKHVALGLITKQLRTGNSLMLALVDCLKLDCSCRSTALRTVSACLSSCSSFCMMCSSAADEQFCPTVTKSTNPEASTAMDGAKCCASCRSCLMTTSASPYLGHYILLVGYDPHHRIVLYRDPARDPALICGATLTSFDAARRAVGTDEDMITFHF